ncbi:hypothetical protein, partial [Wohlfahrtiimonas larvae]
MRLYIIGIFALVTSVAMADVPMLDATTVKIPKSKALNKCIGENNQVIYTQFECADTATKVDKQWIEQANLTFVMPEKYNTNPL